MLVNGLGKVTPLCFGSNLTYPTFCARHLATGSARRYSSFGYCAMGRMPRASERLATRHPSHERATPTAEVRRALADLHDEQRRAGTREQELADALHARNCWERRCKAAEKELKEHKAQHRQIASVGPLYSLIVQYAAECGLDVSVGRAWILCSSWGSWLAFRGVVLRLVARKDIN